MHESVAANMIESPGQKSLLLSVMASFSPVGLIVTGAGEGFVVGGTVGAFVGWVSVKAGTSEFQNAIFSGSMFF